MIDLILGAIALGVILTVFNFIAFYPLCKKERKLIKSGKVSRGKKLLCTSQAINYQVIELPRSSWSYVAPRKVEIILTLVVIVVVSLLWGIS